LYLNQKIHENFKRWDKETETYPNNIRRASLDGTDRILQQFVSTIVRRSTDTDRRLRSPGFPERVPEFNSTVHQLTANAKIKRLAESHRALLDETAQDQKTAPFRIENYLSKRMGIMTAVGIGVAALIGLAQCVSH
jgi:hypothetical protein